MSQNSRSSFPDKTPEWILTSFLVIRAVYILLPAWTPALAPLYQVASPPAWGWTALAIGAPRAAALYVNGRWYRSPLIRLMFTLLSITFWSMRIWVVVYTTGHLAPATIFDMGMLFWELILAYRCGSDVIATGAFEWKNKYKKSDQKVEKEWQI